MLMKTMDYYTCHTKIETAREDSNVYCLHCRLHSVEHCIYDSEPFLTIINTI